MERTQQQAWNLTAKLLTEGERSNDIENREAIATRVRQIFEYSGYPDWWSRLTRLEDDTEFMARRARW